MNGRPAANVTDGGGRRPQAGGKSYPALALSIIVMLFLISLAGGLSSGGGAPSEAPQRLSFVMGYGLIGAILWGIAWLATIRHASRAWKWASLAAAITIGLISGFVRLTL